MVEAGGVELSAGVENTQLADSAISLIAPFAWFARSVARFGTICNNSNRHAKDRSGARLLPRIATSLGRDSYAGLSKKRVRGFGEFTPYS